MSDDDDDAGRAAEPQGRVAGLPYDFCRLTATRIRVRAWNPGDPRVFNAQGVRLGSWRQLVLAGASGALHPCSPLPLVGRRT